jgi:hypothetical protein
MQPHLSAVTRVPYVFSSEITRQQNTCVIQPTKPTCIARRNANQAISSLVFVLLSETMQSIANAQSI